MEFNDYQTFTATTAVYKDVSLLPVYPGLKLAGEAGEVAEKIGKAIRDGIEDQIAWNRELAKELGDVLWYVANIANRIGYTLDEVAKMNIEKLQSRKLRGVLSGSGDNR